MKKKAQPFTLLLQIEGGGSRSIPVDVMASRRDVADLLAGDTVEPLPAPSKVRDFTLKRDTPHMRKETLTLTTAITEDEARAILGGIGIPTTGDAPKKRGRVPKYVHEAIAEMSDPITRGYVMKGEARVPLRHLTKLLAWVTKELVDGR